MDNYNAVPNNDASLPTNQPFKTTAKHICVLVSSIYMALSLLLATSYFQGIGCLIISLQGYLVYLLTVVYFHPTWSSLTSSRHISQYDTIYNQFQQSQGEFTFTSQSYHFAQNFDRRTGRGTNEQKVITYRTTETLQTASRDVSGPLMALDQGRDLVLMEYEARYRWRDWESQRRFQQRFEEFKYRSNRDVCQDASYQWKLRGGLAMVVAFYSERKPDIGKYKKMAVLGLAYPYLLNLEKNLARYKVTITKQLTI